MAAKSTMPLHPLAVYALVHGLDQRGAAAFFKIPYGGYRKIVTGHVGASFSRMQRWEKTSKGTLSALVTWKWQEKHRKNGREAALV